MKKAVVRLNVKELMKAQIDADIKTDAELAQKIGISPSQVWRAKLKPGHPQYCTPGNQFIAGVMMLFGGPFERFFFVEEVEIDQRKTG